MRKFSEKCSNKFKAEKEQVHLAPALENMILRSTEKVNLNDQRREYNGYHRQQLDQDVDGRTRGILEGIAYGVADNSRLVLIGALAAVVARFDVLLSVIPRAAGVRHKDRHEETRSSSAREHTDNAVEAQHQTDNDRYDDRNNGGQDHLFQRRTRAHIDALRVVGISLALHQAGDLLELTANLDNNALSRSADGVHGERRKDKGQASADEQTDQNQRVHDAEAVVVDIGAHGLDLVDIGSDQRERGQRRGTDRKALTGSSGGVAQRIQRVCTLTNLGIKTAHLSDTARVVRHRTVRVGREGDTQCGQHTDSRQSDTVQTHLRSLERTAGYKERR